MSCILAATGGLLSSLCALVPSNIEGPTALATAVQEALEIRGTPVPAALSVKLIAAPDGGRTIVVVVQDPRRATTQKYRVASVGDAATVIESWSREALTDDLLTPTGRRVFRPGAQETPDAVSTAPEATPQRRFSIGLSPVAGTSLDGAVWSGAELRGWVEVWRVRIGGRVAYARDLAVTGHAHRLAGKRAQWDIGLLLEAPIALSPDVILLPGLGVSHAVLLTSRMEPLLEEDESTTRIRTQLGAKFPVGAGFAIRTDLALDFAPDAETLLREPDGIPNVDSFELPPESTVAFWLAVGVEFGGY